MRWDIFCSVVDNLGDIGVAWRLARQLAAEHRAVVRLWVDNLQVFHALAPELDPQNPRQRLGGIEVRQWPDPFPGVEPADIVVETFGCDLPQAYLEGMAKQSRPPVWINLEYLSAEHWVENCHRLPSPHSRYPLTRYFFFPGFAPRTGGVLIEHGLLVQRRAFQADPAAMAAFLAGVGVPSKRGQEHLVSMFCYPDAPVRALLDAWEAGAQPLRLLTFQGTAAARMFADWGIVSGQRRGALTVDVLPFLSQADYDRVLWACDWNFVRGEDSFVRAQLAGRPMVWQAYPQTENSHYLKIEAFLSRYLANAVLSAAPLSELWRTWNGMTPGAGLAGAWNACMAGQDAIAAGALRWVDALQETGDLAANLAKFCSERV